MAETDTKTLYLHIGQPKTGTTAIQQFCDINADALAKQGLVYERWAYPQYNAPLRRNAYFLICDEKNPVRLNKGFQKLDEEFSRGSRVLLTDERLWNHMPSHDYSSLRALMKHTDKRGIRVVIVAYLRPQDGWIASLYRQYVQAGKLVPEWNEFIDDLPKRIQADYSSVLDSLAEIVGRDNLIIRCYDRGLFPGGRIEDDFLQAIGITRTGEMNDLPDEPNPSITNNYTEILRILNPILQGHLPVTGTQNFFAKAALACSALHPEHQKHDLFTDEQRVRLSEAVKESNERVSGEYLEGSKLKLSEPGRIPTWDPDNDQLNEDMILFFGSLLLEQNKRINKLERQLKTGKKKKDKSDKKDKSKKSKKKNDSGASLLTRIKRHIIT